MNKAQLARQLGVSRTYITILAKGKRQPSQHLVNKLRELALTAELPLELQHMVGKGGFEPPRLAAHDPKSCSSASSDTSPLRCPAPLSQIAQHTVKLSPRTNLYSSNTN